MIIAAHVAGTRIWGMPYNNSSQSSVLLRTYGIKTKIRHHRPQCLGTSHRRRPAASASLAAHSSAQRMHSATETSQLSGVAVRQADEHRAVVTGELCDPLWLSVGTEVRPRCGRIGRAWSRLVLEVTAGCGQAVRRTGA